MTGHSTGVLIASWARHAAASEREKATRRAWRMWRWYLCEEANRGHPWMLAVTAGRARVECDQCGVFLDDVGFDDDVYVNARIPVTVWTSAIPVTVRREPTDVCVEADPARIRR